MESSSSGFFSIISTTKTKLMVLSSVLGVTAIFYLTKNYLERGQFFPAWSKTTVAKRLNARRPTIVGGKKHVVIRDAENENGEKKVMNRQRSRLSSRRSSVTSTNRRKVARSVTNVDDTDVSLGKAITDLNQSVAEIEMMLGLPNETFEKSKNMDNMIANEITRLRNLLNYAQDIKKVTENTSVYVNGLHHPAVEDVIEAREASDDEAADYNEIVQSIRNQKSFDEESDYDSDMDSFISAIESVDFDQVDSGNCEDTMSYERKLKELIAKHNKSDFYMRGIEYLTHYGVPVRSIRTDLLKCDNDVDFCVKVHCIRRAFKNLLKDKEHKEWFVSSGKEMLVSLLKKAKYCPLWTWLVCHSPNWEVDSSFHSPCDALIVPRRQIVQQRSKDDAQLCIDFDELLEYCQNVDNWGDIDEELSERGVCSMNFYDIILDFMIMDSFQDLENPPSAITSAINNRWLSLRIKETALSTAIWTVIKSKKRGLQNPAGFFARFYDVSMHLTPLLAWGFLGPVQELNQLCKSFKNSIVGFLQDIFSTEVANYKSIQTLSDDIFRLAKKRKEELLTVLS